MKFLMAIACGTLVACASGKPADDPSSANAVAATTGPTDLYEPPPHTATSTPSTPVEGTTPVTPTSNQGEPPPGVAANRTGAPPAPAVPAGQTNTASVPPPAPAPEARAQPDNTRVNDRDRGNGPPTPMDQGNGASDLKITQQIRQAVIADGSLSFTAKNVKIITNNGKVTLRGPVKTDQERQAIESSARKVAGDGNVDDQIEVKK